MHIECSACIVYLCHVQAWCLKKSEEGVISPELGFQVVVSRPVGAGNQTGVICKSSKCS